MTSKYTPEENKLRELTGGDYFSQEFMDNLNSLNLTVKEANIVINQIKHEITTGECCLEAIPIRLNYLLKQLAPEITKYVVPSKELIAKKELIFLLNLKDNITFCPNCQSSLFLTDKFCYKCGAKNMQSIAIKAPKDDDLNLNEIYCAKLYEKYPLNFKYAYVCFLRYVNENPGKVEFPVFNNIDGFKLKKQAVKDNYFTLGDHVYSISNYTISDIKKVLKKYDLKVSGKKDELIERISQNLSDEEISREFENRTFVLTPEAEKFLEENKYLVYYDKNDLSTSISLEKYESLFKKAKITDSIYDVLYSYYADLINEDVNNKQWHQYRTDLGNLINVSVNNISDLKLLKLHFQYFILEANNWIHDYYSDYCNPSFDLKFNKSRNDLIASLKLELNELQEIFNEAWDEVKIPSYTLAKADAFKKLILAFDGKDLNSIY